jgi:hypothetical protein
MKQSVDTVRLPSGDDSIAPVKILDADGRIVRVISADEFRRDHPAVMRRDASRPRTGARRH